MRYPQVLAVLVTALAASGAGCVSRITYNHDLMTERAKVVALQEKLDRANRDVKKAQDALAEKAAEYTANQKATDDARRQLSQSRQQVERLQNSVKETEQNAKTAAAQAEKASRDAAEKYKNLQDQFEVIQRENVALREVGERQTKRIDELTKRLEGVRSPSPLPPTVQPMAPARNSPDGS